MNRFFRRPRAAKVVKKIDPPRGRIDAVKTGGMFAVLIIFGLGYYYYQTQNMSALLGLTLLGAMAFLPIGIGLGLFIGDKHTYCKTLRAMTHKNYGVVNLIGRDGRNMFSFIKDFGSDIIEKGEQIWNINRSRIYNDKGDISYPIAPDDIKYVSGVPVLFLDYDTFSPLSFWKEETNINPREVIAPLKAFLVTKEMELLSLKKMTQLMIILMIIMAGASAGLAYMTYDTTNNKVMPMVAQMQSTNNQMISFLNNTGTLSNLPQPTKNVINQVSK